MFAFGSSQNLKQRCKRNPKQRLHWNVRVSIHFKEWYWLNIDECGPAFPAREWRQVDLDGNWRKYGWSIGRWTAVQCFLEIFTLLEQTWWHPYTRLLHWLLAVYLYKTFSKSIFIHLSFHPSIHPSIFKYLWYFLPFICHADFMQRWKYSNTLPVLLYIYLWTWNIFWLFFFELWKVFWLLSYQYKQICMYLWE